MSEEKSFKHFESLLPEVRMEIIDQMKPVERCRFVRCSKLSQKEAKKSKNFIFGLEFWENSEEQLKIHVLHTKEFSQQMFVGYTLRFLREDEVNYLIYHFPRAAEYLRIELDSTQNLAELAKQQLKNMLQTHQNQIKRLVIAGANGYDFEITGFKYLEDLQLNGNNDITQFLSKTKRPLQSLTYWNTEDQDDSQALLNFEQTFQVKYHFETYFLKCNLEQVQRMSARHVHINIGGWAPKDIYNFTRSWRYGSIRRNLNLCWWHIGMDEFDVEDLFQRLGVDFNNSNPKSVNLQDNNDARRTASLSYHNVPKTLMFLVSIRRDQ